MSAPLMAVNHARSWSRPVSAIVAAVIGLLLGGMAPAHARVFRLDAQIQKIETAYQGFTDWQAHFTVATHIKALQRTLHNRGRLYLKKPGRLRIEYDADPQRHYVSDGKTLWIYTPGDRAPMSQTLGTGGVPREALAFLNGFGKLRQLFEIAAGTKAPPEHFAFLLTPKQRSSYASLTCQFTPEGLLTLLTIQNHDGGSATYAFSQHQTNHDLPDGMFRKPKPRKD